VIDAAQQDICFSKISDHEEKLRLAWSKLVYLKGFDRKDPLYETVLTDFLNECLGNACQDAAQSILSTFDGSGSPFGCKMLDILYKGNANSL